jgi:Flp pilus assembly protein TadG
VALVEFALVAPVLFLVLFAIVDFGRALNYRQNAQHLTAEGARLASVQRNPGAPSQTLQQYLRSQAAAGELRDGSNSVTQRIRVCISFGPGGNAAEQPVTVSADFDYQWVPFLGLATSEISASSTMRLEAGPASPPAFSAGCAS